MVIKMARAEENLQKREKLERDESPGFFEAKIEGDRESTIEFEMHFQNSAPNHIETYFEVVFWKLYSQPRVRDRHTNRVVESVQKSEVTAEGFWKKINQFVADQTRRNLIKIRDLLGFKTPVLAVTLTLPALASPNVLPMIDSQVACWVNQNYGEHNKNRDNKLSPFEMNYTSLRDNDFSNYLNWVNWCQETAQVLMDLTDSEWRPRDVEMAVFTAERNELNLKPLL